MPAVARSLALFWLVAAPACLAGDTFWPEVPAGAPALAPAAAGQSQSTLSTPRPDPANGPLPSLGRLVQPATFESPVPSASSREGEGPQPSAGRAGAPESTSGAPLSPGDCRAASPSAPRDFHLPLGPRGPSRDSQAAPAKRNEGVASALTVAGSLAVVLGLFFLVVWLMRRAAPRGSLLLPTEVVEVLGRAPLAGRQQVYLVRCGAKLLLVSVTPDGAETLTEIDDPDEVARLAGLCRQAHPNSATATFRQVFDQLSREGPVLGLLGRKRQSQALEPDEDVWQEGRRGE